MKVNGVTVRAQASIGTERIAQNGYHYIKVAEGRWRLRHHIVAEDKYGRKVRENERVIFKDKDRDNFNPNNIEIVVKNKTNTAVALARLIARRDELNARIAELESEQSNVEK